MVFPEPYATSVDHVFQIRNIGGIRPEHLLQFLVAEAELHGQREDVDRLAGIVAEEVGTKDAATLLFENDLKEGMLLADPARRGPGAHAASVDTEAAPRGLCLILRHAHLRQRRLGEDHARHAMVVGDLPVAVQDILRRNCGLHIGDCRQLGARGAGVADGVDAGVADALQELVDGDSVRGAGDPSRRQVEVVQVRHPPGAVHHQIRLDRLVAFRAAAHDERAAAPFHVAGLEPQRDGDAAVARGLGQQARELCVEALQDPVTALQDRHLSPGGTCDVGELHGDIAAADERDAPRQVLKLEKVIARYSEFRTGKIESCRPGSGRDYDARRPDPEVGADFNLIRGYEARGAMQPFDACLLEILLGAFGDDVRERPP